MTVLTPAAVAVWGLSRKTRIEGFATYNLGQVCTQVVVLGGGDFETPPPKGALCTSGCLTANVNGDSASLAALSAAYLAHSLSTV